MTAGHGLRAGAQTQTAIAWPRRAATVAPAAAADAGLAASRRLIWLYFWLLIFEGALRKWVFPGLSQPLLVVRDPVVVLIYLTAAARGLFPGGALVAWTVVLAVVSLATAVTGTGSLLVTVYGLRANYLHLPLVLVMARVLTAADVRTVFRWLLWLSPFMAALAVQQFRGGYESWWNVGAGGTVRGQLLVEAERVRASGTFSFVNGIAAYLALQAAVVLYTLAEPRGYPTWLRWAALFSFLLTLAVSGSRSAVMAASLVGLSMLLLAGRDPGRFGQLARVVVLVNVAFILLSVSSKTFTEGIGVQGRRFEGGGGIRKGIVGRFFAEFPTTWGAMQNAPLFGYGIGVGTNVAAGLSSGSRGFRLAEGEWPRVMLESGPVVGSAYLLLRFGYLGVVLAGAFRAVARGRPLPVLLAAAGGLLMFNGQFGQPTALGFAVFVCGLALAATREEDAAGDAGTPGANRARAAAAPRGRAKYAAGLRAPEPLPERAG